MVPTTASAASMSSKQVVTAYDVQLLHEHANFITDGAQSHQLSDIPSDCKHELSNK